MTPFSKSTETPNPYEEFYPLAPVSQKTNTTMNMLKLCIASIAILLCVSLCASAESPTDAELTTQIQALLRVCKELHAGDTRDHLLRTFTTEGGISTAKQRTFVYRRCPNIKVDVEFTLSVPHQNDEKPTDKIATLS